MSRSVPMVSGPDMRTGAPRRFPSGCTVPRSSNAASDVVRECVSVLRRAPHRARQRSAILATSCTATPRDVGADDSRLHRRGPRCAHVKSLAIRPLSDLSRAPERLRGTVEGDEHAITGRLHFVAVEAVRVGSAPFRSAPRACHAIRSLQPSGAVGVESTRSVSRSVRSRRLFVAREAMKGGHASPFDCAGRVRRRRRSRRDRAACRTRHQREARCDCRSGYSKANVPDRNRADVTGLAPLTTDDRAYVNRPAPTRFRR